LSSITNSVAIHCPAVHRRVKLSALDGTLSQISGPEAGSFSFSLATGRHHPRMSNDARVRGRRAAMLAIGVTVAVLAARHLAAVGASWTAAWRLIAHLGWSWLAGLAFIWLLGLVVHTAVLTASMPGLTHRRALTLNLTGSAVSNLLPLGGVAGTALNLGMVRVWGHSRLDFARFVVVSKAWDLAAKLVMPIVALAGLLLWGLLALSGRTMLWLLGAAGAAALAALVVAGLLGRAVPMVRLVSTLEQAGRRFMRRPPVATSAAAFAELVSGTARLVRRRWAELSLGMCGYWLMQGLLLGLSLYAVGARLPVPVIVAGLATERALTLLALTPGGAGLVETGTIAVFIALGTDPTAAVAGVLLYRGFVFAAEIPVGGATAGLWFLARRLTARTAAGTAG
jgi:uncharacterized membrane protein YbhN (UPF0104 family)